MVESQTLLPFVTLLFLVVVELSGRLTETDIGKISEVKQERMLELLPNLGFFTLVHCLNVFLLMVGYLTIIIAILQGYDTIIVRLLLVATGGFLFLLPYLEIEEYDLFMHDSGESWSLLWHIGMSLFILAEPIVFIILGASLPEGAPIVGAVIFLLVYYIGVRRFLKNVKKEFQLATNR